MKIEDINLSELIESETGEHFNRAGYICCPFHNEKTPSLKVKFNSNTNKYIFKCFGCGATGDAIDFIEKLKNVNYMEARKFLGLEVEKTEVEKEIDKLKDYISWQIEHHEDKKGYKVAGIFPFVNSNNKTIYYKVKFIKPDGSKITPYYHLEGDKVINNRGTEEVPYNLYNVLKGIEEDKIIIFVEGEKDANTINQIFKNNKYVATSIKGCKNLDVLNGINRIYVIGDTGEAGLKYVENIKNFFLKDTTEFKIINLPGLKMLGNNKDVTDWIEAGNNKYDLLKAFRRSLDFKNINELQQDWKGIYKSVPIKDTSDYKKVYITDFSLIEAKRLIYVDDEKEGFKIKVKSPTGKIIERSGPSTVFDDTKSFKNFLGTLDLSFTSKNVEDLTKLKQWINIYWAIDNESVYKGTQFVEIDNRLTFVASDGAINKNGRIFNIVADNSNLEITNLEEITTEELKELKNHIFKFLDAPKSISIIGSVINYLAEYQNKSSESKQHILLIVGESQSGKSTILEKVIFPILNYTGNDKKSMATSPAALLRDLSTGNYPAVYDEFKPSTFDKYKITKLSGIFRDVFDRNTNYKGDKAFNLKKFKLERPLIMAGEENYPNSEVAAVTRSCIVYLSKRERTDKHRQAIEWLEDHRSVLNKFGKSLINIILNLSTEEYKAIRKDKQKKFKLTDRTLNTALNIASGIEIFNLLLKKHGLKELQNYEEYIYKNIKEEILDNGTDTKSTVEQMLCLYNDMIEDGRAYNFKDVVIDRGDGLFIRTSEMINQICTFCNQVGSAELIPLKQRDFKKQAKKSGYLISSGSKVIKIDAKSVRFDEYSKERMRELKCFSIVQQDMTLIEQQEDKKIIEGLFNNKFS